MRVVACIWLLLSISGVALTQSQGELHGFHFEDFIKQVKANHPVAMQAELLAKSGEAELLKARGLFDPKAVAEVAQKYFDGSQYYSQVNGGLKIPTWFGVELKAMFDQNQGKYLNPENSTPRGGLLYTGISLPLGQGLMMDERRKTLQQAKRFVAITLEDRKLMYNELLYNAGNAYWAWFAAFHQNAVNVEALKLSEQRFRAVKQAAYLGDKPYIDTLEASLQVQSRWMNLQESQRLYSNRTALLSTFLWLEGLVPLELEENMIPVSMEAMVATQPKLQLNHEVATNHPKLKKYGLELEQQKIENKWNREQLKPVLNLNYNPISEVIGDSPYTNYDLNNYTWGATFSMPLFLRKERGRKKGGDLKLTLKSIDSLNTSVQIGLDIATAYTDWSTALKQLLVMNQNVSDYFDLLKGERRLFDVGESSLFMVNSRESGYVKAKLKLIDLLAKKESTALKYYYLSGNLWEKY